VIVLTYKFQSLGSQKLRGSWFKANLGKSKQELTLTNKSVMVLLVCRPSYIRGLGKRIIVWGQQGQNKPTRLSENWLKKKVWEGGLCGSFCLPRMSLSSLSNTANTKHRKWINDQNHTKILPHSCQNSYHQEHHQKQMLVRKQGKKNPSTLLVGILASITTLENNMEAP
jgi:hypothetical protein